MISLTLPRRRAAALEAELAEVRQLSERLARAEVTIAGHRAILHACRLAEATDEELASDYEVVHRQHLRTARGKRHLSAVRSAS
jgi:hypothetical protein